MIDRHLTHMSLGISVLALLACLVLPATNALVFGLDDVAARDDKIAIAAYQKPSSLPKSSTPTRPHCATPSDRAVRGS
jgi:hypothetical protein